MERCATLQPDWVGWILARNLFIMLIFFGGWHHFLYASPFRQKLADKKYNPRDYNPTRDRKLPSPRAYPAHPTRPPRGLNRRDGSGGVVGRDAYDLGDHHLVMFRDRAAAPHGDAPAAALH